MAGDFEDLSPPPEPPDDTREDVVSPINQPPDETWEDVLNQIKGGDIAAFDRLFLHFAPRFYRYAVRRLSHVDANDVVQITMTKIILGIRSYDGKSRAEPWMLRICHNNTVDRLRVNRRLPETTLDQLAETLPASDSDPELLVLEAEQDLEEQSDLREAFRRLSTDDQQALKNGPGPTNPRKAWREAIDHLKSLLEEIRARRNEHGDGHG